MDNIINVLLGFLVECVKLSAAHVFVSECCVVPCSLLNEILLDGVSLYEYRE